MTKAQINKILSIINKILCTDDRINFVFTILVIHKKESTPKTKLVATGLFSESDLPWRNLKRPAKTECFKISSDENSSIPTNKNE